MLWNPTIPKHVTSSEGFSIDTPQVEGLNLLWFDLGFDWGFWIEKRYFESNFKTILVKSKLDSQLKLMIHFYRQLETGDWLTACGWCRFQTKVSNIFSLIQTKRKHFATFSYKSVDNLKKTEIELLVEEQKTQKEKLANIESTLKAIEISLGNMK